MNATVLAPPTKPVENWEAVLQEWLDAIDHLFDEVEGWCLKREWATLRTRTVEISEGGLGTYEAPVLLIHLIEGRLILRPEARMLYTAQGRIQYTVLPSYESWALIREKGEWFLFRTTVKGPMVPWTEETFDRSVPELLALQ